MSKLLDSNREMGLSYDDVSLLPQYSEIRSRKNIDLTSKISRNYSLRLPIVASPMNTICEYEMAKAMYLAGGMGVIHRFMTVEKQSDIIAALRTVFPDAVLSAAVGVKEEDKERCHALVKSGVNIIMIDVAHGHSIMVKEFLKWFKNNNFSGVDIIAGSIGTSRAARQMEDWRADGCRFGISGGSICSSAVATGTLSPMISNLMNIQEYSKLSIPVICDGGIRTSGDMAKAIAAGASTVMVGSFIAGTDECPGEKIKEDGVHYKIYRGSASYESKIERGESEFIEGVSKKVKCKGSVALVLKQAEDGLKSALSYSGCANIEEFREEAQLVRISPAVHMLGNPHN